MTLAAYVGSEARAILDRRTAGGKCIEVCPVTAHVDPAETPESIAPQHPRRVVPRRPELLRPIGIVRAALPQRRRAR